MTGRKRRGKHAILALFLVVSLVIAACGDGDTGATTTTEADSTPTTADQASDTTTPAADTTEPAEDDGLPEGDLNLKIGHPSTISLYDVHTKITNDRLNAEGWNIEDVEFARTGLNPQALAQNAVQFSIIFGVESLRTYEAGGDNPKIQFVMDNNSGEFALIAKSEYPTCQDFDGIRFGIHGETSATSTAAVRYIREVCGVEPETLIVPGGENRIVALENDELDATLVQFGDWFQLELVAEPGEFVIVDSGDALTFNGASWWVNTDWVDENYEVATAYVAEHLRTCRMIREDPTILEDAVRERLEMSEEIVSSSVETYLTGSVTLCPEGGLVTGDHSVLQAVVDYNVEVGEIDPVSVESLVHPTLLQDAIAYLENNP